MVDGEGDGPNLCTRDYRQKETLSIVADMLVDIDLVCGEQYSSYRKDLGNPLLKRREQWILWRWVSCKWSCGYIWWSRVT
jgi:hypothetical protein